MPLPDDWNGRPGINDITDLADDDPTRCQATRGEFGDATTPRLRCNRPAGHDAAGFGHYDLATCTVWWPETGHRGSSFHEALIGGKEET